MPVPRTGAGSAVKLAPSTGTAPRFVRCSTIGMPARSSSEWAGRAGSAVESMLSESIPTSAAPCADQQVDGVRGQERVVAQVRVGAPVAVEARVDEDRAPGEVVREQLARIDRR